MGDSASANPGNHCYIDSRKGDSHWVHDSDPTRTRTYICLPFSQPVVTPPPGGHSRSHWLRHFPTTIPSGINTPHVPSQSFFIQLPMKIEPIVPKCRLLEPRRRGITQKKTYYTANAAKA
jgi:hypothetical protein